MVKSLLKFGVGQECATEGLVHLIDLISTETISKLLLTVLDVILL